MDFNMGFTWWPTPLDGSTGGPTDGSSTGIIESKWIKNISKLSKLVYSRIRFIPIGKWTLF